MSRHCRIVPRPRHVIVPHMQLSQNEVLGLSHPNRTPLGAALSEGKPVTRGWSQGWLLTPLPHHTLPREPQTQSYDIASLPAILLLSLCFTLVLEIRSFLHSGQVVAERLPQPVAAQKPRIKRPYGLRDLPSLPSSREIQFVHPWPASEPSFYIGLFPVH